MANNGGGWSDATKWTMGIVAALITAVAGAWALRSLGPEPPPTTSTTTSPPEAVISIAEFKLPFTVSGRENVSVAFTIANEGNAVARRCQMRGDVSPFGDEFSIQPNSERTITWGVRTYGLHGRYKFSAYVQCENASSVAVTRDTVITAF
jgi:hypothetical protein